MNFPPFLVPQFKVQHARYHLAGMQQNFQELPPLKVVSDINVMPDGRTYVNVGGTPDVPIHFALLTGDVIHNLRSALDIMACDMAAYNGRSTNGVLFPFGVDETSANRAVKSKNFDRCGRDAVNLYKKLRPWRGGNNRLRAIHDLDISDKHVRSIPAHVSVYIKHARVGHFTLTDAYIVGTDNLFMVEADVNTPISWTAKYHLSFERSSIFGGQEVIPTLLSLCDEVGAIVDEFGRCTLGEDYQQYYTPVVYDLPIHAREVHFP